MNHEMHDTPFPPSGGEEQRSPGYRYSPPPVYDAQAFDLETISDFLISDFSENTLHDARGEIRIVYDSEGQEVAAPVVAMTAALIFQAPTVLVNYPLPELFTRVKHCLERPSEERAKRTSATMPMFADIRRQVHDKLMAVWGGEVSQQALTMCCSILATLVLNRVKTRTRLRHLDASEYNNLIKHTLRYFAEELALLEEACYGVDHEAIARGLHGTALVSWCVRRINTEFIGHPPDRHARHAKRRR